MHDMRFNGNQPRIMHFERVKVGDHYSVRPETTLGPTQEGTKAEKCEREKTRAERKKRATKKRLASLEGEE
jgi:hypothetical protein